jgi:hypothetical protein
MESAGFGGDPDFLVDVVTVDDDLRSVVEFDFQQVAAAIAIDPALICGCFYSCQCSIGQLVEFTFVHGKPL